MGYHTGQAAAEGSGRRVLSACLSAVLLAACAGGGGDATVPVTTLTSPNGGEVVGATTNITWSTDDASPETVEIRLSSDSGASFPTVLAAAAPDTGTFSWDTSAVADGSTYRIRITPTDTAMNVGDPVDSAGDLTVDNTAPTISLVSPGGGEVWGGSGSITWTTTDANPGTVEIRLSGDSGASFPTVLAAAAPDTGAFSWDTSSETDDTSCRIRVVPTDAAGNLGAGSESGADFELDNTAPTISLTSPVGGEAWKGTHSVTWTTIDANPGTVEIRLSSDSGASFPTVLAAAAPDTGTFSWDTATAPEGTTFRVRVVATDAAQNPSASSDSAADFAVDNVSPTITLTAPTGGEHWAGTESITWTTTDANPGTVEVRLSSDSGASFPTVLAAAAADTGTFSWDTTAVGDAGTYRVRVVPTDAAGNVGSTSESATDFTVDNTDPTIALTAPAGGEVWTGTRSVTWTTTDDNPGTVEVLLSSDSGASYPTVLASAATDTGSFSWDTTTTGEGTTYRVRVTPTDLAGNVGTAEDSTSDFTLDHTPKVSGLARYIDADGDGAAGAGDLLIVPFDRDVVVNTASSADFTLPVTGDSFGTGASVAAGPGTDEVTITLGTSPSLKSRQTFDSANTSANDPSGVDVSGSLGADAIEGAEGGYDAAPSTPIDIVPGWVQGAGLLSGMAVAAGDLDGDGDVDLAIGNGVYLNDGTGTFSWSGGLGAGDTRSIAFGDLDADGDLDAVSGTYGQPNEVLFNDGAGSFTNSGQSLASNHTFGVALGDLDGDGDLDLVSVNSSFPQEPNRVWLNDGAGTLVDSGQSLGTGDSGSVGLGDLDGDGDLDMVVGNINGEANRVYVNDGSATFSSGQAFGGSATYGLALGDVDGDGDLDVAAGNRVAANRVWLNDGAGSFSDSGQTLGSGETYGVTLGDVDADGDLDMASLNFGGVNRVWLNDGSGTFVDSGQTLGLNESVDGVLADVDGDGDLDMPVANANGQTSRIWINSLSGTWGTSTFTNSGTLPGANLTHSLVMGDVDRDGDADMAEGNFLVLVNDDSGGFSAFWVSSSADTRSLALGDVDRDGILDIVTGNNSSQSNRVFLGDGDATFTDSGQGLGAYLTNSVALGDLDHDGDLDLVEGSGNLAGDAIRVYDNDPVGTFTDSGQTLGTTLTWSVALGDVDRDGDLDIVAGKEGANQVWLNDGTGTFTDSGQSLGSSSTRVVALGDLDSDGDLDFVEGLVGGNRVWLNDGSGTFTDSGQSLGSWWTYALSLGDVDGDGDLDIAAGNTSGQPNRVWLNDGSGTFTDSGLLMGSSKTEAIVLSDVDGDGDLDFVAGNFTQGNRVWFNR